MDARVRLRIGTADRAGPDDALLIEGDRAVPEGVIHARFLLAETAPHSAGCACCLPRGPVAEALSRLFLQRVRGEVTFFPAVLAIPCSEAGEAAIRSALQEDPVVMARFRLLDG